MRVIDKRDYEIYSLDHMLRRERTLLLEQAQAELWNNGFWLYDFMEVSRSHNYLVEFYLVGKEPDVHDAEVYLHRLLKKFSSFYGISCTRFTQKKEIQFYLGFCAFGKSSKKKYPLRNEIIVSVNRSGLSIRILAGHCLWGKSYFLYEYQIVGNVISDYIEKVLSENRECFDKFKKYREKLEQDLKEVSVSQSISELRKEIKNIAKENGLKCSAFSHNEHFYISLIPYPIYIGIERETGDFSISAPHITTKHFSHSYYKAGLNWICDYLAI